MTAVGADKVGGGKTRASFLAATPRRTSHNGPVMIAADPRVPAVSRPRDRRPASRSSGNGGARLLTYAGKIRFPRGSTASHFLYALLLQRKRADFSHEKSAEKVRCSEYFRERWQKAATLLALYGSGTRPGQELMFRAASSASGAGRLTSATGLAEPGPGDSNHAGGYQSEILSFVSDSTSYAREPALFEVASRRGSRDRRHDIARASCHSSPPKVPTMKCCGGEGRRSCARTIESACRPPALRRLRNDATASAQQHGTRGLHTDDIASQGRRALNPRSRLCAVFSKNETTHAVNRGGCVMIERRSTFRNVPLRLLVEACSIRRARACGLRGGWTPQRYGELRSFEPLRGPRRQFRPRGAHHRAPGRARRDVAVVRESHPASSSAIDSSNGPFPRTSSET